MPLDALNPEKSLTKYRFKLMYVHLTNVYDNLPFDDLVRRDGKLYLVEVRAYLNGPAVDRLIGRLRSNQGGASGHREEAPGRGTLRRVSPGEKGVEFWRRLWDTFKLEERLRALDDREEDHVPPGLNRTHLEDLLAEAPDDVRFHISRGRGRASPTRCRCCIRAGICRCRTSSSATWTTTARVPGARQAGWLARDLGQRRAAARRRRPRRLRRALRAVPVPARHEDEHSVHDATRLRIGGSEDRDSPTTQRQL